MGQKKHLGAQINFTSSSGGKTKKKGLHPGLLPCFVAQVSLGGQGEGALHSPLIQGVKTKKKIRSSMRNLRLSLGVHSYFLSWSKILLTLGDTSSIFWGSTGPEMHSSGTGHVTFFRGTILDWGHTSRLGGTSSDLEGRPEMPSWRRACLLNMS